LEKFLCDFWKLLEEFNEFYFIVDKGCLNGCWWVFGQLFKMCWWVFDGCWWVFDWCWKGVFLKK